MRARMQPPPRGLVLARSLKGQSLHALPSGPWKGRTTDRELVERKRLTYFETLGWDERGIPKAETLQRLGLEDLEPSMKGLRA